MNFKDRANAGLLSIYNQYGKDVALKVANKTLNSKEYRDNFEYSTSLNGELCETVLLIHIMDYMKRHPKETSKWRFSKGIIIKDKFNQDSVFMTELDVVLFTPATICLFECKSYVGENILIDYGTLVTEKKKEFNVFNQSKVHEQALLTHFESFRTLTTGSATQLFLFDFSKGKTIDKRDKLARAMLIYINSKTIDKLLDMLAENKKTRWDMKYINKAMDIIDKQSPKLREKHLEYVKSIHGDNNVKSAKSKITSKVLKSKSKNSKE